MAPRSARILLFLIGLLPACRSNPFAPPENSIEGFDIYTTDFTAQNDGGMKAALLEVINGSRATLYCAFSALTLTEVSSALVERARAGVQVKVAFDADVRDSDSGSLALQASGAFVVVATPGDTPQGQLLYGNSGTGTMRHNYCLADERYVWISTAPPDDTQMRLTPNVAIRVGSPQFGLARDFLRESSMFSQLLFGGGKAKTDYTTKFAALDQVIAAYWGPQEAPMDVLGTELSEATRTVDFYSTAFQATNTSSTKSYLDVPTVLKALETAKGVTVRKYFSSQALFDSASKAYTLANPSQYVNSSVRVGANIFVVDRNLSSARTYIYTGALRKQGNSSDDSVLLELRGPRVAQLVGAYLDRIGELSFVASNTGDTPAIEAVIISEINWAGSYSNSLISDDDDEFVELYNTTNSTINISNWGFICTTDGIAVNGYFVLPAGAVIPAHGYFTIARKSTGAFPHATYFTSFGSHGITNSSRQCKLSSGPAAPDATPVNYAALPGTVIDMAGDLGTPFDSSSALLGQNDTTNKIRRSLERRFPITAGNLTASWQMNVNSVAQNTEIASPFNQRTFGTPGAATSMPVPYIALNRTLYFTTSATHPNGIAKITGMHIAANTNAASQQTIVVNASSTSDPTGVNLTLTETGNNTGIFTSEATGTHLNFTNGASAGNQLHVVSGDTVTISYTYSGTTYTATAQWYQQNLMINEIGSNCGGAAANDYIEIHNPNAQAVSLTGMTVYRDAGTSDTACTIGAGIYTSTINLSGTIAGHGYVLATGNTYAAGGACPAADIIASSSVNIDDFDCIALVLSGAGPATATDDEVIDFVGIGNSTNPHEGAAVAINLGGGSNQCISRAANGYDGNQNGSDFVTETLSTCSPRATNPLAAFDLSTAGPSGNVNTLILTFTRAPDSTQGANTANYSITGSGGLLVSAAVVSGNTVTLTTSAQTPGAAYTITLSGISAAAGGTALGTNSANFFGYQAPGTFKIVELSIDGSPDAVELRCTSAGSIGGFRLYSENTLRYTLPVATFGVGDIIVFHPQASGTDETAGNAAASGDAGATVGFDFWQPGSAITSTDSELRLTDATGMAQDYVAWSDGTFGSGQSARIETQISAGQWTKAAGAVTETDVINSTIDDAGSLCLQRVNTGAGTDHEDSNSRSDWIAGTCNLGINQGTPAPAFNVTSANAFTDSTHIVVNFNNTPNFTQSTTATHYCISLAAEPDCSGPDLTVSAASLSGNAVTLTTSTQVGGAQYRIYVTGVKAAEGGASLTTGSATFIGYQTSLYEFTGWTASSTSGSYPTGMSFKCTTTVDATLAAAVGGGYIGPTNATATGFGLRGEGSNGISLLNTGSTNANCPNGGDGLLATIDIPVNTVGRTNINVYWSAAQISDQGREWGLRLQYSTDGSSFSDVPGPVEFRTDSIGSSTAYSNFGPTTLPVAAENNANLILRWRYYYISGAAGSRTRIAIDEIKIAGN